MSPHPVQILLSALREQQNQTEFLEHQLVNCEKTLTTLTSDIKLAREAEATLRDAIARLGNS